MQKLLLSLLGFLLFGNVLIAQSVEDIRAEVSGDIVIITYDLKGDVIGQKFDVEIYARHNNYSSPLQLVSGNVGKNIDPGFNRRVEWRAKEELKNFSGTIDFEVRATLVFSPIAFLYPSKGASVKKGKNLEIRWKGGLPTERFNIEIYKGTLRVQEFPNQSNDTKKVNWLVPKKADSGSDYEIRITSITNPSNATKINDVKVKSGGGAVKILVPLALVGGAVYYFAFAGNLGKTDPIIDDPVEDLPLPPAFPIF